MLPRSCRRHLYFPHAGRLRQAAATKALFHTLCPWVSRQYVHPRAHTAMERGPEAYQTAGEQHEQLSPPQDTCSLLIALYHDLPALPGAVVDAPCVSFSSRASTKVNVFADSLCGSCFIIAHQRPCCWHLPS